MDQELVINATLSSVAEVFGMMIGLAATPGESYIQATAPAEAEGVVTLIGLAGSWIGAGSLSCSLQLACKLSSALLLEEITSINNDVLDAMAEITNMVFGNVKTALEAKVGPLGLSIPTVVFGRNFSTNSAGQQIWNVIPYQVESEKMDVKICLAPNKRESNNGHAALQFRTRLR